MTREEKRKKEKGADIINLQRIIRDIATQTKKHNQQHSRPSRVFKIYIFFLLLPLQYTTGQYKNIISIDLTTFIGAQPKPIQKKKKSNGRRMKPTKKKKKEKEGLPV